MSLQSRIETLSPREARAMRYFTSQNDATLEILVGAAERRDAAYKKQIIEVGERFGRLVCRLHT